MYCLEQSLRVQEKFIVKQKIFAKLNDNSEKDILSFYWWNPLLHPDLDEIILHAKEIWFSHISILTNTFGLSQQTLTKLIDHWLTGVNFYFNSLSPKTHDFMTGNGISLQELLKNIKIIQDIWLHSKAIIHINAQNIQSIYKDLLILYTKFWIQRFDFINYFPFDRPYDQYKDELAYDVNQNRENINKIFKIINKLSLEVKFLKFSKDFFWNSLWFYSFRQWILDQIWPEDIKRLQENIPFCYTEKRCKYCFIKDHCKFYALR